MSWLENAQSFLNEFLEKIWSKISDNWITYRIHYKYTFEIEQVKTEQFLKAIDLWNKWNVAGSWWFFLLNSHFQSINSDECAKIGKSRQSAILIIRRIKKSWKNWCAIKIRKFYTKTKFNRTNDSFFLDYLFSYKFPNFWLYSINVLWICSFRQRNRCTKDHII